MVSALRLFSRAAWVAKVLAMISRVFWERLMVSALRLFSRAAWVAKVLAVQRICLCRSSLAFLALIAILVRRAFFIVARALALYSRFLAIWVRMLAMSVLRLATSDAICLSTFLK